MYPLTWKISYELNDRSLSETFILIYIYIYIYIYISVEWSMITNPCRTWFIPKFCSTTDLFENWNNATRADSASRSAAFGSPRQSIARVSFSSARLVCSNSEHLFDHCGIFYSNAVAKLRIVRFESLSITEGPLYSMGSSNSGGIFQQKDIMVK